MVDDIQVDEKDVENEEKDEKEATTPDEEEYNTNDDPVIIDAFSSMKSAILSKRTDIVRQIICAAESIREDDYESDSGDEAEPNRKAIRDKYDSEEYIDMLSLLLRHKDTDSGTLLHIATRVDHADIVRTLLAAGCNCLVENHEKKNAYMYCSSDLVRSAYIGELLQAVSQVRVFRIEHLLKAGIDVNSCDSATTFNSILHWAVCFSDLNVVSLIIERGAHVNACNVQGTTPLHEAVNRGHYPITEELLKCGADVNVRAVSGPYEGKTARNLCMVDFPEFQVLFDAYESKYCNGESSSCHENGEVSDVDSLLDFNGNITYLRNASSSSSISMLKHPSMCPVSVNVDPLVSYLCPPPQCVKQFKGLFFVPPGDLTVYIENSQGNTLAMHNVFELFTGKFQMLGVRLSYEYVAPNVAVSLENAHVQCVINKKSFSHTEEYKIQINTHKVFIVSSCIASFFYALSTFMQCLKLFRGKAVPLLQISDWPKCAHRSIVLDFSENDIPKLDVLLECIDLLATYKVNQIQLNVEHLCCNNNDNNNNNNNKNNNVALYTKSESFRLQVYCKKRFITVVPYIRLNHNSPLVRCSDDSDISELCTDTFEQRVSAFPFLDVIHAEIGLADNQKVIHQLYKYCNKHGYVFQLTSKEIDIHIDEMPKLLNGVVCTIDATDINDEEWNDGDWNDHITAINELGLQYITCYDCSQANRIYPNVEDIVSNTYDTFSQSLLCNCYGMSIKFSFKAKRVFSFLSFLPSLIISSAMLWNSAERMKTEAYILNVINYLVYEDDKDHMGRMFVDLGRSLPLVPAVACKQWSGNARQERYSLFDIMLSGRPLDTTMLNNASLQKICRTIKLIKQNLHQSKVESALQGPFLRETSILLDLMYLLSRISYRLIDLKSKTKNINFSGLPEVNKSDESNRLMILLQEYQSFCVEYCVPSSNGFVTLFLLQELLQKIMPKGVRSSGGDVKSICTIQGAVDI